jgi:hypothetical protein
VRPYSRPYFSWIQIRSGPCADVNTEFELTKLQINIFLVGWCFNWNVIYYILCTTYSKLTYFQVGLTYQANRHRSPILGLAESLYVSVLRYDALVDGYFYAPKRL